MDIYKELIAILVSKLAVPEEDIKEESSLEQDLGADELDFSQIITQIETVFHILIAPDEREKLKTVINLFDKIIEKLYPTINLNPVIIHPDRKEEEEDDWYKRWYDPTKSPNPYPWLWPDQRMYPDPNIVNNPNYYAPIGNVSSRDKKIAKGIVWALNHVEKQTPYKQQYGDLRTANTPEALQYIDCSEFVSRYLAEIGLTSTVQTWNTDSYVTVTQNTSLFDAVYTPAAGDIYLWKSADGGHIGIVRSYNPSTGMVTYLHETSYGKIHWAVQGSANVGGKTFRLHAGWRGFFRPKI